MHASSLPRASDLLQWLKVELQESGSFIPFLPCIMGTPLQAGIGLQRLRQLYVSSQKPLQRWARDVGCDSTLQVTIKEGQHSRCSTYLGYWHCFSVSDVSMVSWRRQAQSADMRESSHPITSRDSNKCSPASLTKASAVTQPQVNKLAIA